MKQIIQNLKTGETKLEEVPAPQVRTGHVLIRTSKTLVSLGTERMLVEFGKAGLIAKARQQPEKVKMVLDKIKSDGLLPTLETVFAKLEQPLPLGYCNMGRVIAVGAGVHEFQVGDRVVSNGQHAEFVCVPRNLVAHVPEGVSDEEAAFTVIGAIGLQGIRLLKPTFGETICVIGLGLIGLITAELLRANGCRVIGVDLDPDKLKLAAEKGIVTVNPGQGVDPVSFVEQYTGGVGADGVIITASAKTNDIISQAARMSRKRGRIILVGVIGLQLSRAEFYDKELSFQVSCSYGPGRYDEEYEQKGHDYPLAFVRWTEKRNFEAVLHAMAAGQLQVRPLISELVELHDYLQIYDNMGNKRSIASILSYPQDSEPLATVSVGSQTLPAGKGVMGVIGAGNFTKMAMLPALKKAGATVKYIASAGGVSGTILAQKHGIAQSTTDYRQLLSDPEVELVLITTRHHQHAAMVRECLAAGKHVFVEKPLAIRPEELPELLTTYESSGRSVTVGFNRRFSPHIQKMKALTDPAAPKNLVLTMNAGFIPPDSWVHDMEVGGGRIIGEACHYLDLAVFLSGSRIVSVCMNALGAHPAENTDNASILLRFENGDQAVVNYFANGHKSYSKERVELYSQGKTLVMDNFRTLKGFGYKGFSSLKTRLDKGHFKQFELLTRRIQTGGEPLIPFAETLHVTQASFAAIESLRTGEWVRVP